MVKAKRAKPRRRTRKLPSPPLEMSKEEYRFWLCHGVNFLVSDEDRGVWDPLFPSVYGGALPSLDNVFQTVMARYGVDEGEPLTAKGKMVLAWVTLPNHLVRVYKLEAERRAGEGYNVMRPHNPVVWGLMTELQRRFSPH